MENLDTGFLITITVELLQNNQSALSNRFENWQTWAFEKLSVISVLFDIIRHLSLFAIQSKSHENLQGDFELAQRVVLQENLFNQLDTAELSAKIFVRFSSSLRKPIRVQNFSSLRFPVAAKLCTEVLKYAETCHLLEFL